MCYMLLFFSPEFDVTIIVMTAADQKHPLNQCFSNVFIWWTWVAILWPPNMFQTWSCQFISKWILRNMTKNVFCYTYFIQTDKQLSVFWYDFPNGTADSLKLIILTIYVSFYLASVYPFVSAIISAIYPLLLVNYLNQYFWLTSLPVFNFRYLFWLSSLI